MRSLFKKICIASDHAGFGLKNHIIEFLIKNNISIIDLGPTTDFSVDYPDFAKKVSRGLNRKKVILVFWCVGQALAWL